MFIYPLIGNFLFTNFVSDQNQQCSTLAKFNHSPKQDGARTGMPIYKQNLEKCAKLKVSEECSDDEIIFLGDNYNESIIEDNDNCYTQASKRSSGSNFFAIFSEKLFFF